MSSVYRSKREDLPVPELPISRILMAITLRRSMFRVQGWEEYGISFFVWLARRKRVVKGCCLLLLLLPAARPFALVC